MLRKNEYKAKTAWQPVCKVDSEIQLTTKRVPTPNYNQKWLIVPRMAFKFRPEWQRYPFSLAVVFRRYSIMIRARAFLTCLQIKQCIKQSRRLKLSLISKWIAQLRKTQGTVKMARRTFLPCKATRTPPEPIFSTIKVTLSQNHPVVWLTIL